MAITPLRVLLFVVAAIVAAAGTAYYTGALDSRLSEKSKELVSLPDREAPDGKASSSKNDRVGKASTDGVDDVSASSADNEGKASADAKEAATGNGGSKDDPTATAEDVVAPGFDVVRVEPDGSLVIAGSAAPNAQVEVVDGATVIGRATTGPSGDFAVVLDDPLDPGDYQLVLRATSPDGIVATSKETAVVSVPDNVDGQVLALVEQPGEPSRLITVPKGENAKTEVAAATPEGNEPGENGDSEQDGSSASSGGGGSGVVDRTESGNATADNQQVAMSASERDVDEDAAATAGNAAAADSAVGELSAEAEDGDGGESSTGAGTAGDGAAVTDGEAESAAKAGKAGDTRNIDESAGEGTTPSRTAEASPDMQAADDDGDVAATRSAADTSASDEDVSRPAVFIEAVEIDGEKVFVAGLSQPDRTVRVYANEILLGDARVSPGGRFLIEARRELPVGDYIIRADLLNEKGSEVIARAAVPFERPEGDKVAAVAPKMQDDREGDPGSGAGKNAASADKGTSNAASGSGAMEADNEPTEAAQAQSVQKARQQTGGGSPGASVAISEAERADAEANDTAAAGNSGVEFDDARQDANSDGDETPDEADADEETARAAKADNGDAGTTPGDGSGKANGSASMTAPKLQTVDNAVIIRRGDTLWQISRRVYGRGIRYTNIYLANQEQIRDPHWIWPGQVFAVPDKTHEGVEADMSAIGDQAVPLSKRDEGTSETSTN